MNPRHKTVNVTDLTGKGFVLRDTVEIEPGVFAGGIPQEMVPRRVWCSLQRQPNGSYVPVARTLGATIRVTKDIGRKLGIALDEDGSAGASSSVYWTIKRLIWAGFVKAYPLTDSAYRLDLESFWRFYQECAKPGFWNKDRSEQLKAGRYGPEKDAL